MKDFLLYSMASLGLLIILISVIKMWIIDTKNMKSEQKRSKSKHVKLLIFGLIFFVLSRILHGHFL